MDIKRSRDLRRPSADLTITDNTQVYRYQNHLAPFLEKEHIKVREGGTRTQEGDQDIGLEESEGGRNGVSRYAQRACSKQFNNYAQNIHKTCSNRLRTTHTIKTGGV